MPQALPRPPDLPPPQQRRSNRGTPARHDLTDIGDSTASSSSTDASPAATATATTTASCSPPPAPDPGGPTTHRSEEPTNRRYGPWSGCTAGRTSFSAGRPGPARRSCSRPSASTPSSKDYAWPGSPSKTSASSYDATAPTTP